MNRYAILTVGLGGAALIALLWVVRSERPASNSPERTVPVPSTTPSASDPEAGTDPELLARLTALEARVADLENRDKDGGRRTEKPVPEKTPSETKRTTSSGKSPVGIGKLRLTPEQRTRLEALFAAWKEEDRIRKPDALVWRAREAQMHGVLAEEERAQMHEALIEEAQTTWSVMGMKLGSLLELPPERWGRLQGSLGPLEIPPSALLREAHGLDWTGLVNRAAPLLDPHLEPEQQARLRQAASWRKK